MKKFLISLGALFIMQTVFLIAGEDEIIWMKETHSNNYVEFSPNKDLFLTQGRQGGSDARLGIILFNTAGDTIKQIYNSEGLNFILGQGLLDAHFSQDGRFLVAIWEYEEDNLSKGMIEIFETDSWNSLKKISIPGDAFSLLGSSVIMSPDNNTIVGTTQDGFYFYNSLSGELIKNLQIIVDNKYVIPAYSVYSKDGSHIYFTSSDGKLRFLNTQTFEVDYSYNAGYGYLTCSNNGRMLAFKTGLSEQAVQIMDIETKVIIRSIPGIVQAVSGIAFSNDNTHLGVAFQNQAILNIYNINSGEIVKNLLGTSYGTLSYSFDDKYIISHASRYLILLSNKATSVKSENDNELNILYPNPTNNTINIKFNLQNSGIVRISLYDEIGKLTKNLFTGHLDKGEQNVQAEVSNLKSGIYFVKVSSLQTEITFKLMINR
ncbi:MAG: T9SS type A sorting domain-containing protein [Candidatus Kapabacteria bacterium]|nr:T9SS type A sorting domain-containing protein [Candidatus Kapabacteria bacterium]